MEDCLSKRGESLIGESLMEDFSGKIHVFGGRDPHAWLHLNRQSSLQAQDLFGEKDPRGCRILGGKGIRFWLLFGHHTHHKWTGRESLEAVTQPYEKKKKSLLDFFNFFLFFMCLHKFHCTAHTRTRRASTSSTFWVRDSCTLFDFFG